MESGLFLVGGAGVSVNGVISAAALALSGFAAWRANQRTGQGQREADALVGDLPPNFALQPLTRGLTLEAPIDSFVLRVENHNRRPIRLSKIAVEQPKKTGLVAYLVEGPRERLIGSLDRKHHEIETNLVVDGTRPGAPTVSAIKLKLVLAGIVAPSNKRVQDITIGVEVGYEILSTTPEQRSELVRTRVKVRG